MVCSTRQSYIGMTIELDRPCCGKITGQTTIRAIIMNTVVMQVLADLSDTFSVKKIQLLGGRPRIFLADKGHPKVYGWPFGPS